MTTHVYMERTSPDSDDGPFGDILVVEDNDANLLAVQVALAEFATRLVPVKSGEEALRVLLKRDFALVLLDVQMPGMDGFDTARLIRARDRSSRTPIIFLTAFHRDDAEILKAYDLGAVDFLFKPIVPEILRAKVAVFVSLEEKVRELERQSELIRQHEQREADQRVAAERRRWEAESLAREVEEERRAAERLKEVNARLEEADRRKDEFLAMLGHELRNPLAPIVSGVAILQQRLGDDESFHRVLDAMDRQSLHLTRLVDDLLEVSRVTSGKVELRREMLAIGPVIQSAVDMTAPLVSAKGHTLEVAVEDPEAPVWGDAVRLAQVVSNLLTNAARYTPEGGHVNVRCRVGEEDIQIEVEDDGPGIPADLLPSVFDMFVQGRPGSGGLGIGLTLVQRLVALHGGLVAVDPSSEKGAVFIVRLPLADGRQRDTSISSSSVLVSETDQSQKVQRTSLRIAVVDDNDDVREMLQTLLELWGHSVRCANDGLAGVELLTAHPVDVAIVDIGMPNLDGYGVAEQVRRQRSHESLFMVALTGFGDGEARRRALRAGFDAHLVKPVDTALLARTLDTVPSRQVAVDG